MITHFIARQPNETGGPNQASTLRNDAVNPTVARFMPNAAVSDHSSYECSREVFIARIQERVITEISQADYANTMGILNDYSMDREILLTVVKNNIEVLRDVENKIALTHRSGVEVNEKVQKQQNNRTARTKKNLKRDIVNEVDVKKSKQSKKTAFQHSSNVFNAPESSDSQRKEAFIPDRAKNSGQGHPKSGLVSATDTSQHGRSFALRGKTTCQGKAISKNISKNNKPSRSKRFQCCQCDYSSFRRVFLIRHIKSRHDAESVPHTCPTVNMAAGHKSGYADKIMNFDTSNRSDKDKSWGQRDKKNKRKLFVKEKLVMAEQEKKTANLRTSRNSSPNLPACSAPNNQAKRIGVRRFDTFIEPKEIYKVISIVSIVCEEMRNDPENVRDQSRFIDCWEKACKNNNCTDEEKNNLFKILENILDQETLDPEIALKKTLKKINKSTVYVNIPALYLQKVNNIIRTELSRSGIIPDENGLYLPGIEKAKLKPSGVFMASA